MAQEKITAFDEATGTVGVQERLWKYLIHWRLMLICVVATLAMGALYISRATPMYLSTAFLLIKGSDGVKPVTNDLIESALKVNREVNLNNEMLLFSSESLMERTVTKNMLNLSYFAKGKIIDTELFDQAPFKLTAGKINEMKADYRIDVFNLDANGGIVSSVIDGNENRVRFSWNVPFTFKGQNFVLSPKLGLMKGEGEFIVTCKNARSASEGFLNALTVKPYDSKTSVIQFSIKTGNAKKGEAILNSLISEFIYLDLEDRRKSLRNTFQFIDERLQAIASELNGVETSLEEFQGKNNLSDIKGQSALSLENSNNVSKTIKELGIQQRVTSMILEYFANPTNEKKLVPSSLGIDDNTLASLITQYNELQLKKERESPRVAYGSTVMEDLNTQLGNLKSSILESLRNISKNLELQAHTSQSQNNQYKTFLASLPRNERVLLEIKRKQSITEGLYLYLLQKREESAIYNSSLNVVHYQQIDMAKSNSPVEPNSKIIAIYSGLAGLFLSICIIYLRAVTNKTVISKKELQNLINLPIIGEISHVKMTANECIPAVNLRIPGDQLRRIRTKAFSLLEDKSKKVILITSSSSNEGKSFTALNLAAVCAAPGKRIALLEFDLRNPVICEKLGISANKGLMNFLSEPLASLTEIIYNTARIPTLDIFPSGKSAFNPSDLLLHDRLNELFKELKNSYDYIIIDSPPIGNVSDSLILSALSDIILFIVRKNITLKSHLDILTETLDNTNMYNVQLLFNGADLDNTYREKPRHLESV